MYKLSIVFIFLFSSYFAVKSQEEERVVEISTMHGNIQIKLYNNTPKHRDNFIKLVSEGYYDGTLFHRVIKDFMIQGGDPDSRTAKPNQTLGTGGPNYTVTAEFVKENYHKKGALAAARQADAVNPTKASSGSQFYIVHGRTFSDDELTTIENRTGNKFTSEQRKTYKTIGGTPHLDGNYTVFGEVISGIEIVDSIANIKTGTGNRPVVDIKMEICILK